MTKNQRKIYIEQIKTLPERLGELIRTFSIKQLDTPYGKGKWTARQVVHHLADAHLQGFIRIKWALTENNPTLKTYEQDDWAKLSDYSMPIDSSLEILRGLHHRWTYLLENLSEDDWIRPAVHPDPNFSNVEEMLKVYAGHGEKHLEHIRQVLS